MNLLTQIITATKTLLSVPAYRALLIPLAVVVFAFFVAIPTIAIPGNTFALQLSLYTLQSYLTLGVLAVLAAFFFLMNVYAYRQARASRDRLGVVAKGGAGGALGALASVFGAASCPMCVASLFGFLGFGTVGFLARNQWWVFSVAIALMMVSLYFTSRKMNGTCRACEANLG